MRVRFEFRAEVGLLDVRDQGATPGGEHEFHETYGRPHTSTIRSRQVSFKDLPTYTVIPARCGDQHSAVATTEAATKV